MARGWKPGGAAIAFMTSGCRRPRVRSGSCRAPCHSNTRRTATPSLRVVEATDAALTDGFHPYEAENGARWTDGDARLPATLFRGFGGACELELHVGGTMQYPLADAVLRAVA